MDVECPVCGLKLSPTNINSHVNMCLDQTKGETKTARADSLKCSVGEPCAKRVKVDGEITKSCPAKKADWGFMVKKSDSKTPVKGTLGAKSNEIHLQQNSAEVSKKEVDVKSTQNRPSTASFDLHSSNVPLAERVRPTSLKDFVGQEQTIGRKKLLRSLFEANKIPSMIFWGPPGCGKVNVAPKICWNVPHCAKQLFVTKNALSLADNPRENYCSSMQRVTQHQICQALCDNFWNSRCQGGGESCEESIESHETWNDFVR